MVKMWEYNSMGKNSAVYSLVFLLHVGLLPLGRNKFLHEQTFPLPVDLFFGRTSSATRKLQEVTKVVPVLE